MDERTISLIQRVLAENGYYDGRIDGIQGDGTNAGIVAMIARRSADLAGSPDGWSIRRKAIACLQLGCGDAGRAVGPIDGLWGPQTDNAVDEYQVMLSTGREPVAWRDETPLVANPHDWPLQAEEALTTFFSVRRVTKVIS